MRDNLPTILAVFAMVFSVSGFVLMAILLAMGINDRVRRATHLRRRR